MELPVPQWLAPKEAVTHRSMVMLTEQGKAQPGFWFVTTKHVHFDHVSGSARPSVHIALQQITSILCELKEGRYSVLKLQFKASGSSTDLSLQFSAASDCYAAKDHIVHNLDVLRAPAATPEQRTQVPPVSRDSRGSMCSVLSVPDGWIAPVVSSNLITTRSTFAAAVQRELCWSDLHAALRVVVPSAASHTYIVHRLTEEIPVPSSGRLSQVAPLLRAKLSVDMWSEGESAEFLNAMQQHAKVNTRQSMRPQADDTSALFRHTVRVQAQDTPNQTDFPSTINIRMPRPGPNQAPSTHPTTVTIEWIHTHEGTAATNLIRGASGNAMVPPLPSTGTPSQRSQVPATPTPASHQQPVQDTNVVVSMVRAVDTNEPRDRPKSQRELYAMQSHHQHSDDEISAPPPTQKAASSQQQQQQQQPPPPRQHSSRVPQHQASELVNGKQDRRARSRSRSRSPERSRVHDKENDLTFTKERDGRRVESRPQNKDRELDRDRGHRDRENHRNNDHDKNRDRDDGDRNRNRDRDRDYHGHDQHRQGSGRHLRGDRIHRERSQRDTEREKERRRELERELRREKSKRREAERQHAAGVPQQPQQQQAAMYAQYPPQQQVIYAQPQPQQVVYVDNPSAQRTGGGIGAGGAFLGGVVAGALLDDIF